MNVIEIRKWFEILRDNKELTEVRVLDGKKVYSGYFKDIDTIIDAIRPYEDSNIYFTLNGINEACYSRSQADKIMLNPKAQTSDGDIVSRRWLLIDIDPKRPSDTNASDLEKKQAEKMMIRVGIFLRDMGFPQPLVADSGNGYHLLYKINLEPTDANRDLIKKFLNFLALQFDDEYVQIDTSVFNNSRICKLYGTHSRKGSNTDDRPQRISRFIRIPDDIRILDRMQIEKVSSMYPEDEKATYKNNYDTSFNIDDFISRHSIQVYDDSTHNNSRRIRLKECPFNSNHKAPDSALFVSPNGAIGFTCFHSTCQDKRWKDVRELYEPKYSNNTRFTKPLIKRSRVEEDNRGGKFLAMSEIEAIDRSAIISVPSGIKELDKKIIGFNLGEISIWSGNNASGKSTLLGQIALNSIEQGFPAVIYSGELTANRVKNWIQLQAAGRQHTLRGYYSETSFVSKENAALIDKWCQDKLWIYNNRYGSKLMTLLDDIRDMVSKGVKTIILDNLMAIDILIYEGDKYDKQSQMIKDLCSFVKENDIHLHLVAHPRKVTGFLRKTDIAGTADLTNAVDNVFIVHRVNNDFIRYAGEYFGHEVASEYFRYGNVIEVCKNRDLGVQDYLVGLYFEIESRRFLNEPFENINYGWIPRETYLFESNDDFDLPPD